MTVIGRIATGPSTVFAPVAGLAMRMDRRPPGSSPAHVTVAGTVVC
jgi:hypothetical protein